MRKTAAGRPSPGKNYLKYEKTKIKKRRGGGDGRHKKKQLPRRETSGLEKQSQEEGELQRQVRKMEGKKEAYVEASQEGEKERGT